MSGVKITEHFAQRMKSTILRVEAMPLSSSDGRVPVRFDERPTVVAAVGTHLGKTTAAWSKGTSATITLYEEGSAGSETMSTSGTTAVTAYNKFAAVASGKWVWLQSGPFGAWYLTAAECS